MLDSIERRKPNAMETEVYYCIARTWQVGTRTGKSIVACHKDYDILYDSIELLVNEQILAFKKERNCQNKSVFARLGVTPVAISISKDVTFFVSIALGLSEDYKESFVYRFNATKIGGDDTMSTYAHRDDDYYFKAVPIKKEKTPAALRQRKVVKSDSNSN